MEAQEFLQAALAAGARIEFVDGRMVVTAAEPLPPGEYIVDGTKNGKPVNPIPRQKDKPVEERTSSKNYQTYKAELGESGTAVLASGVSVLIGIRTNRWRPSAEDIVRYAKENLDMDIMRESTRAAVLAKRFVGASGRRRTIKMSASALAAAIYAALDGKPSMTMSEVKKVLESTAFARVAKDTGADAETLGGPRAMEFRRQSYANFLNVLTGIEE